MSDLVELDVDPDDDDSLSFESVIKSGGDDWDFWYDHPHHVREEPELPNFEPIDSPARSPEEGPQEERSYSWM